MLSRVADNLYWMSRYLERAEHTARLIDVNLNLMLDQTPAAADARWERLADCLHTSLPSADPSEAYAIARGLTFDADNPASIVACIAAARENTRRVREQISSEMWRQLNQLYLFVREADIETSLETEPHQFFQAIKEGAHLFEGLTGSTMNQGEGWHFIQVGRFVERAGAIAALLDSHFQTFGGRNNGPLPADEYLEWIGLLKSCTAFEAYRKVYSAELRPDQVAEFLLLNPEFPHAISFSIIQMQAGLQGIAEATETRKAGRVYRLAGRLRAGLDFDAIDEIMATDLHAYLQDIQRQCAEIHQALYQMYIDYPIESALETG